MVAEGLIPYFTTVTKTEAELEIFAVQRNATHGQQLTQEEKKKYAVKWWGVLPDDAIKIALSIPSRTFEVCTKNRRDEHETQIRKQIYEMYLRCESKDEIADTVDFTTQRVGQIVKQIIAENENNRKIADSFKFRDFEQEGSALRIYDIWNFSKATNEVRHFGNIPPEIIDNLLL